MVSGLLILLLLHLLLPVSYTHLDVYKRQVIGCTLHAFLHLMIGLPLRLDVTKVRASNRTVSYTHLDVYKRQVINTVKIRKLQYLGHLMRNEKRFYLLQSILQGKVLGKRGSHGWEIQGAGLAWIQLTYSVQQKVKIVCMISNIRNG